MMDRPGEQGIPFKSGLFIDNATVTLNWAGYDEFESACRTMGPGRPHEEDQPQKGTKSTKGK